MALTVLQPWGANSAATFTFGGLSVTGNITSGNVQGTTHSGTAGTFTGNVTTGNVSGTTGAFTNVGGTLTTAAQTNITSVGTLTALTLSGNVNMSSKNINNLLDPVSNQDAATKYYVDLVAQGLHVHTSTYVATTGNLATATGGAITYNNGASGVGANLVTTGTYLLIDGGNIQTVGTRILVKNEANTTWNGVYTYSNTTVIVRATDFDNPADVAGGDFLFVTSGTTQADTSWVQTTDAPITFGTSAIVFAQFSGAGTYQAGTGLTLTGQVFSVNASQTQITTVGTLGSLAVTGNITSGNLQGASIVGTLLTSAQPNITSVGTLTSLAVTGNITSGNVSGTTGAFTNVGGTLTTAAQASITSVGTLTSLAVTGNVSVGNISATNLGNISSINLTGNSSNVLYGNGIFAAVSGGGGTPGGLNTYVQFNDSSTFGGNANFTYNKTTNTLTAGIIAGTDNGNGTNFKVGDDAWLGDINTADTISLRGQQNAANGYIVFGNADSTGKLGRAGSGPLTYAGAFTATGNVTGGNLSGTSIAGTLTTAAQTNITSVGTLGSLAVTGNITSGNLSGTSIVGTLTTAAQTNITSVGTLGSLAVTGNISGANLTGTHYGAATGLTSIPGANVTGTVNNSTYFNTVSSVTFAEALRSNRNINGGGTISVDGSGYVGWTSRYIVIANGNGTNFSTSGYFDITQPIVGTITGVGGASNTTATAAGIQLTAWQALYYILPIGSNSSSLNANFRVVAYTGALDIPHDWVLICVVNGDNNRYYFNNGITLTAGTSYATATYSSTLVPVASSATTAGTVTTAAQPNITSVGTLTSLAVTGNITSGNLSGTSIVGTLTTAAQPNITSVGTLTSLAVTGNITSGNVQGTTVSGTTGTFTGAITTGRYATSNVGNSAGEVVAYASMNGGRAYNSLDFNSYILGLYQTEFLNLSACSNVPAGATGLGYWFGVGAGDTSSRGFELLGTSTPTLLYRERSSAAWRTVLDSTNYSTYALPLTGGTISGALAVTGNVLAGNLNSNAAVTGVTVTATGNVTGGNVVTSGSGGNISGANVVSATTISTTQILNSGANAVGNIGTSSTYFNTVFASKFTGTLTTAAQTNITSVGTLTSLAVTGNITGGNLSVSTGLVTLGGIVNANGNAVGNIGSSTLYFNTVFAKATSAQYADLAELYTTDNLNYPPGTCVAFGGIDEITQTTAYAQTDVAGVVSTNPAYIMNAGTDGLPVALQGRVPCRVVGTISKGDLITSSDIAGVATRLAPEDWRPGVIIGKSLQHFDSETEGVIEVVVGRF